MSGHFTQTVVCDFEYEIADGDLPNVLCMVCYVLDANLQHVRTIKLWRGEFGTAPPFDIRSTLFVAYSAWAELTCFKVLGWKFPTHVFDCHTAYLAASNTLLPYNPDETRKRERKRLPDACRAYGIEGWELIDKEEISKAIGEGCWREYGKDAPQFEEDVKKTFQLLVAQLRGSNRFPRTSAEHVLHWSNYSAKAVSLIQAKGMPIDMYLWNLVQENKQVIVAALVRKFDPSRGTEHPIYTLEGEWSYERFKHWLSNIGVIAWPRLDSGRLDTDSLTLSASWGTFQVSKIYTHSATRLVLLSRAKIPIGRDGRNRPSLFPFATASGRNAQAKSLYNAHASMRSFMMFPPDKIGVYLDWRTQEVGDCGGTLWRRSVDG